MVPFLRVADRNGLGPDPATQAADAPPEVLPGLGELERGRRPGLGGKDRGDHDPRPVRRVPRKDVDPQAVATLSI